jgi:probable DNA metabolism protein
VYRLEISNFAAWRTAARPLLAGDVEPGDIAWSDWRVPSLGGPGDWQVADVAGSPVNRDIAAAAADLATPAAAVAPDTIATQAAPFKIPRPFLHLLEDLACYRDPGRWELMYRLAWRVSKEGGALLDDHADIDVALARNWQKAIHRDVHKMHAFVRFNETEAADGTRRYVAWFEPEHEILRRTTPFFEKRFPNMRWMIATPDGAVVWSGDHSEFIESPARSELPREDQTTGLWRAYYRNICNVARINPVVMQREMPQRYWKHLPEASEISGLISNGRARATQAIHKPAAGDDLHVPRAVARSLERITQQEGTPATCRACSLWRNATQVVTGEGPQDAQIMLVGEQPGDEEDLRGRPFVGPAGRLLDTILSQAGLDRSTLFLTNTVKHFKWEPRGKRRLHKRPGQEEVRACSGWLASEIDTVAPKVIVALGATAIRALTGSAASVEQARERPQKHLSGAIIVCTYHPSAILRSEGERRAALESALRSDLQSAAVLSAA